MKKQKKHPNLIMIIKQKNSLLPSDTNKIKNNFIFENFNKSFDIFGKEEMSSISKYINENF